MSPAVSLLLISLVLLSCKTQEEIRREEALDRTMGEVEQQQRTLADTVTRMQSLEEKLATMTGRVDEIKYDSEQTYGQKIAELTGRLELLEQTSEALSQEVEDQREYGKKVVETIEKMAKTQGPKRQGPYWEAMGNYKRGRYKTAKGQLLALLEGKKVKGARRARVLHNLGMISFMDKNDDQSLTYFSKLFTDYPKSSYNKNGLLFLAKSFRRLDQKDQAQATLEELLTKFPEAKQKNEARRILAELR